MITLEDAKAMYQKWESAELSEMRAAMLPKVKKEYIYAIIRGILLDRLEAICDAERDGRLVVLPCKIGTKVYFISQDCEMCRSLQKDEPCLFGDCPYRGITETIFTYGAIGQFGKTVFLTRAEAEAALRKEQSDER